MDQRKEQWSDPIVAEVRATRDHYARQFNYSLDEIVKDLQRHRVEWKNLGVRFVDPPHESVAIETTHHNRPKDL